MCLHMQICLHAYPIPSTTRSYVSKFICTPAMSSTAMWWCRTPTCSHTMSQSCRVVALAPLFTLPVVWGCHVTAQMYLFALAVAQLQNMAAWSGLFPCLSNPRMTTCLSLGCRSMGRPVHTHMITQQCTCSLNVPIHTIAVSQHHHGWSWHSLSQACHVPAPPLVGKGKPVYTSALSQFGHMPVYMPAMAKQCHVAA